MNRIRENKRDVRSERAGVTIGDSDSAYFRQRNIIVNFFTFMHSAKAYLIFVGADPAAITLAGGCSAAKAIARAHCDKNMDLQGPLISF